MDALEKRVSLSNVPSINWVHPIETTASKLKQARDISYACGKFTLECVRPYDNRVYVAGLFAKSIVKHNWERLQDPVEDTKIYPDSYKGQIQKCWDKVASIVGEVTKKPLCKTTAINSFVYALIALNYSKEKGFYWSH